MWYAIYPAKNGLQGKAAFLIHPAALVQERWEIGVTELSYQ